MGEKYTTQFCLQTKAPVDYAWSFWLRNKIWSISFFSVWNLSTSMAISQSTWHHKHKKSQNVKSQARKYVAEYAKNIVYIF